MPERKRPPARKPAATKKTAVKKSGTPKKTAAAKTAAAQLASKPAAPPPAAAPEERATGDACPRCGTSKFGPEQRIRAEGSRTVRYTILVCERGHTFARPIRRAG